MAILALNNIPVYFSLFFGKQLLHGVLCDEAKDRNCRVPRSVVSSLLLDFAKMQQETNTTGQSYDGTTVRSLFLLDDHGADGYCATEI